MADNLITWLHAQFDADERQAPEMHWPSCASERYDFDVDCDCFEPQHVHAEIEAKRRVLHAHGREHECIRLTGSGAHSAVGGEPWELWEPERTDMCLTVRLLALPYANRDGYKEDWRP